MKATRSLASKFGAAAMIIGALHALPQTAAASAEKAAVEAAAAKITKGEAILVDVREADEIKDGIASPAIWLATSEIDRKSSRFNDIMKALPKNKEILVYCASGVRAGRFVDQLTQKGYKATNFGAYADWRDAGKSVKPVVDAQSKPCPFLCNPAR